MSVLDRISNLGNCLNKSPYGFENDTVTQRQPLRGLISSSSKRIGHLVWWRVLRTLALTGVLSTETRYFREKPDNMSESHLFKPFRRVNQQQKQLLPVKRHQEISSQAGSTWCGSLNPRDAAAPRPGESLRSWVIFVKRMWNLRSSKKLSSERQKRAPSSLLVFYLHFSQCHSSDVLHKVNVHLTSPQSSQISIKLTVASAIVNH